MTIFYSLFDIKNRVKSLWRLRIT